MKLTNNDIVRNLLLTRQSLLRKLLDPRRDLDEECGYPADISIHDYVSSYRRGDLAQRVVNVFPKECWVQSPVVLETEDETETEFERTWQELNKRFRFHSALLRADILSGIGRFGVLLLGVSDGKELHEPVDAINDKGEKMGNAKHDLLYVRPFDESLVIINRLETDMTNPRYGLPVQYEVHFTDTARGESDKTTTTTARMVHWSRILHICDNRMSSDVFGQPRMEVVFNRLLDLRKVAGGSAEMFWKGGFPGLSLEAVPGVEDNIEFDKDATKEQMELYMNGLQRYIATIGMSVKSLAVQIADPRPQLETQVRLIAMALEVPWRVLMGVEVGQLASEQDIVNWNRRLNLRREEYITPFVIRPFIDRLIAYGVLPEPKEYQVQWPDLNAPKDEDKATVAEKRTNALSKYVSGGVDTLVPPFHYLTVVLGLEDDEATAIIKAAVDQQANDGEDDLDLHPKDELEPDENEDTVPANR